MRLSNTAMRTFGLAAVLLCAGTAQAGGRVAVDVNLGFPFPGASWGGVGVGVGVGNGWGRGYGYGRGYGPGYYHRGTRGWAPRVILSAPVIGYGVAPAWGYGVPQPIYVPAPAVLVAEQAPVSVPANRPDPVVYPRNGQDGRQTEADRQQCDLWATTQPAAVADASVFQRAVEACMDGRGYTLR